MTVRVRDNGYSELMKVSGLRFRVRAGILGDHAMRRHAGSNITVGSLASIHEHGLGVPRRSFIRDWFDQNMPLLGRWFKWLARSGATQTQMISAADHLGQMVAGSIRERIMSGIGPQLKPETIKRKGSSVPLIDTRQLINSITSEVEVLRR
jgi:hypothetical protein